MRSLGRRCARPSTGAPAAATRRRPGAPVSVVHTPVALMITRARTSSSSPRSRSRARTPASLAPSCRNAMTSTAGTQHRALRGRRARERHGEARVVDLGVVVADAARERVLAQRRHGAQTGSRARGAGGAASPAWTPASASYRSRPGAEYARSLMPCLRGSRNGVGWTRCGARVSTSRRRSCSASRTRPQVESLEVAEAPWMSLLERLDVPAAKSRFSTSATESPRLAASSATPQPVTPPPTTSTSNVSSASCRSWRLRVSRGADAPREPISRRALGLHQSPPDDGPGLLGLDLPLRREDGLRVLVDRRVDHLAVQGDRRGALGDRLLLEGLDDALGPLDVGGVRRVEAVADLTWLGWMIMRPS